ncbi:Uncharacterised protein [Streptococcus pneumoniae]|nr:Uncharacterised protein [Streptococcus pneumoniae]CRG02449.1 Uncharacterised protein [Streptococcus pneumoniae]
MTFDTYVGPTPVPTVTLPATGLLEVTNGYVPWSMSNITPWAPSNSTFSSATIASSKILGVSVTNSLKR